jgi:hypothetical protein
MAEQDPADPADPVHVGQCDSRLSDSLQRVNVV